MNRQFSGSRLIAFQEIRRNWIKHEERLIHIKPTLSTRLAIAKVPSARKTNLLQNLDVEMENKALLKKLTDRPSKRSDLSMCSQNLNTLAHSNRKKYYEQYKIRCQNEGLFRRLKHIKPMIHTQQMMAERKQTQKYINTISKFGYKSLKPNKTMMKFQMTNNDLKYLSQRKILIKDRLKSSESPSKMKEVLESRIVDMQNQKRTNNKKLFEYFSRRRQITIDQQEITLKIERKQFAIVLEIKKAFDKQNNDDLVVQISKTIFRQKFDENLQLLLNRLKFDTIANTFYIK